MSEPGSAYRVLARKYRPSRFAELIGHEAMVRTLTNAIESGRIAHAFILSGVRGVGKTTTARLIARALNCIGPDGKGSPTISPCGECEPCRAIAEDRHVDVLEMDAASRTGVDDIRELIEGVRYRPVAARYKVYIIDEVHMLSKSAFNALLKTLEEPPPDVKFIFATTEIQKLPLTVLSRCQRFSLRRVPLDLLAEYYARIAEAEGVAAEPAAIALIARAADGSVRDGLSILDQAIALGGTAIAETQVRDMLGIADRGLVFDLLETALKGDAAGALKQMGVLYEGGADPVIVLQDLLELVHFLTRLKLTPSAGEGDAALEGDRARGLALAGRLQIPSLARAWQMIMKGIGEAQTAPSPVEAAEMVLVRLAYVADLPTPAELARSIDGRAPASAPASSSTASAPAPASLSSRSTLAPAPPVARGPEPARVLSPAPVPGETPRAELPNPASFLEVLDLFDEHREALLRTHLYANVHLVRFEPGRIELRPTEAAPANLPNRLGQLLTEWTGRRWVVSVSDEPGRSTLRDEVQTRDQEIRSAAAQDPLVRAVLDTFPGARIESVREIESDASPAPPAPDEPAEGDDA
jgi:DNA polymerase III subunit gamma/tau